MNILFVNYGDFTTNSLNHIGAFADQLTREGHSCAVAVPDNPGSIAVIPRPFFIPATFERALQWESVFADRRGADIIHAWTPRENVREFTLAYLARHPTAALFIHLEDNEVFLMEAFARAAIAELRDRSDEELATRLSPRLSHPIRFRNFLRLAHGVTVITEKLREFVPEGKPTHLLLPGVNAAFFAATPDPAVRRELGLTSGEKLLVYTGGTTFANLADIRSLLTAVRLINERGTSCRLLRTGINPPELAAELNALAGDFVIDLGFVDKGRLPLLLAAADVLVQPGAPDAFNDYRLPSKLPEFLAAARPVVTPRANLAREMMTGRDALLLESGSPQEIAAACLQLFAQPELARQLAEGGRAFAKTHFDLSVNTRALLSFYNDVRSRAASWPTEPALFLSEDTLLASGDTALRFRAKDQSISAARQKVEQLEKRLRRADAEESYRHAKLQAERNRVEVLREQLAAAASLAAKLREEANRVQSLHRELAQRDEKLKRMIASFSWQVTSPLRALRRWLIDPKAKHRARPPLTLPRVAEGFQHAIDQPRDWAHTPSSGRIRGWVLAPAGTSITDVRLRSAHGTVAAVFGLPRPDVAQAQPENQAVAHSGFEIEYTLPPDSSQPLALEALTSRGTWQCFATQTAQVISDLPPHLRRDYTTWVERFDTLEIGSSVAIRARIEALPPPQRPLISILMPTYDTPEPWLRRAIDSVRAQLYPHWELCIADDASPAPHVRRILEDYARRDERVKLTFRSENGHISAASNSALALARGEFVALFDHDDELAPNALAEIAFALLERPEVEFIYSDEDKIDEAGRRSDPYFKPDWNPDLLLAQNYTCHLSVFRTARVRDLGGFRSGVEGCQDWDLTLRVTNTLKPSQIYHLPRILYHWRAIAGSTALASSEKGYIVSAARKTLSEHAARSGFTAELLPVGSHWRLKYPLPVVAPKVSIIIPTRNGEALLRLCLTSLLAKTSYPQIELIVVNNRSDDAGTLRYLEELRTMNVKVLDYDAPFNYSAINNAAVRHASGEVLAFLNNDLEVINNDWLDEMVSQAMRPEIGAVGAMLYYPDDTVQHAGIVLGIGGQPGTPSVAGHAFKCAPRGSEGQRNRLRLVQNYSAVTAACTVVRRSVFKQVGGFNEAELAIAFNDVDFCLRVRAAGYRNLWTPFAELYHHESASRGLEDTPEKQARFAREVAYMRAQWGPLLDDDPAYNSNLTAEREDFSLAFPPRNRLTP